METVEPRVLLSGTAYTTSALATFNGTNGNDSLAELTVDASGNLYGTTQLGGANDDGTIFEIPAGTTTLTTLISFDETTNGSLPSAGLTFVNGDLYGTTSKGGDTDNGTVFKFDPASGVLTTLASFDYANGSFPDTKMVLVNGNLYGTAGNVYELNLGDNSLTAIASFGDTNGSMPNSGLVADASGNLYGTAMYGPDGTGDKGEVFKVDATTHALTTLVAFDGTNGNQPRGGLTIDSSGNLFGTTKIGGANNAGNFFEIAEGSSTATTLATFTSADLHPYFPVGALKIGPDGNFYGTALNDFNPDLGDFGAIFMIDHTTDAVSVVATLDFNTAGETPNGGLVFLPNGNIYGTTQHAGAFGDGAVFQAISGPVALPASKLAFDNQPADTQTGGFLAPVTVDVEDASGNVMTSDNSYVTIALASNPGNITIGGTTTVQAVNGKATFSGLSMGDAGTFSLEASDGALTEAFSNNFTVTSPPTVTATKLVFDTQPTGTTTGQTLSPFTVNVEAADGTVISDNSSVTLALAGSSGVALGGTLTVRAAFGTATFSNITLPTAGTYSLVATDGSLASATSNSFSITDAGGGTVDVPTQIALIGQPAIFPDSITITAAIEDAAGSTVTTLSANGTLNLTDSQSHTISSDVTIANGILTASIDLSSLNTGVNYTASISSGAYSFTLPSPIKIPDIRAIFLHQLAGATSGVSLPAFAVSFVAPSTPDVATAAMHTNASHKGHHHANKHHHVKTPKIKVDLEISSGPAGAKLYGRTKATAKDNTVTFKNIKVKAAGPYVLVAHADGYADAYSNQFAIAAGPAKKIEFVSQPPANVAHGQPFNVELRVLDRYGNLATTDTSTITLSASPKKATLNGVLSATPVDGLAEFTGLSFDDAGKYSLKASDSAKGVKKASMKKFTVG